MKFFACLLLLTVCSSCYVATAQTPNDLALWYNQPAKDWNEALPIGNGNIGAMIFGGVYNERLQLNEKTVWSGRKNDFVNPEAKAALPKVRKLLFEGKYLEAKNLAQEKMMGNKKVHSSYQTLCDLQFSFHSPEKEYSDYKRELDLRTATSTVAYTYNNTKYSRKLFCSSPDNALVGQFTADKPGAYSLDITASRAGNKGAINYNNNDITLYEHVADGNGVQLFVRMKVVPHRGTVSSNENGIHIHGADSVTIYVTAATDYWKVDPKLTTSSLLEKVVKKTFEESFADHVQDYQKYFNRVDFNVGSTDAVYFPTDLRLKAVQNGNEDPGLIALYYQFGRYLLISSSRPGSLPANLQGLWADGLNPPWEADYHININIQMNYWPSEVTNLAEMHEPFFKFLSDLTIDGRKTAKDMYGLDGSVAHFTTDAWHFTEPYGETQWAMWPMGLAWCAQHPWQHYLFREDKAFLKNVAYPIMKDAAMFCAEWLVHDPKTKMLVSGPSISPENTFKTANGEVATMVMGPTMDHMIIRELFMNTIEAASILGVDTKFRKQLEKALSQLAPVRTTKDGRIMEWTQDFEEPEPGHRHISHLYGLYPGSELASEPALLDAARKTIEYRLSHGGGHTGWSRAWIINFYARLQDSEKSYQNLLALLRKSTLTNLFDNHPPFQIDGNFGATAGITEMLIQSHTNQIQLLPALPKQWKQGHLKGVRARGGFVCDMTWREGTLSQVKILSVDGKKCNIKFGDKTISFDTKPGSEYVLDGELRLSK